MSNWNTIFIVFVACFAATTILGFLATKWKSDKNTKANLEEWGLGGRKFGAWVTWFLIGADYSAYTIVAVPALVYAVGAYGFFALPYAILAYPFIFLAMPPLWKYAKRYNHVTSADVVGHRFSSRLLALCVALTGFIATMPYIALQVVGMGVVFKHLGLAGNVPIIISFIILGVYTYVSGLRAPALIACIKDIMLYIVVIAAVIIVFIKIGGIHNIFVLTEQAFSSKEGASLLLDSSQFSAYVSLAIGSALALFMYPHTLTGIFAASSAKTIRTNAIYLPIHTIMLGVLALFGYAVYAVGINLTDNNQAVTALISHWFPAWFTGFAFAAIAIGALVPAAVMSIGASNLFTRNIWKAYINPNLAPKAETYIAKIGCLIVLLGSLGFILFLPITYALNFQLLGGLWILQTLPAVLFGFFTNIFRARGLLVGWAIGLIAGTYMVYINHLSPLQVIHIMGTPYQLYIGILALALNIVVAGVVSLCISLKTAKNVDQISA